MKTLTETALPLQQELRTIENLDDLKANPQGQPVSCGPSGKYGILVKEQPGVVTMVSRHDQTSIVVYSVHPNGESFEFGIGNGMQIKQGSQDYAKYEKIFSEAVTKLRGLSK